ncbi:hypothetical protein H106_04487 [Trichophyton rubrum CBS 735.88]|nr:hypothetical protein H106_04487 [Trichophyton rubrum CBS 735.88]
MLRSGWPMDLLGYKLSYDLLQAFTNGIMCVLPLLELRVRQLFSHISGQPNMRVCVLCAMPYPDLVVRNIFKAKPPVLGEELCLMHKSTRSLRKPLKGNTQESLSPFLRGRLVVFLFRALDPIIEPACDVACTRHPS